MRVVVSTEEKTILSTELDRGHYVVGVCEDDIHIIVEGDSGDYRAVSIPRMLVEHSFYAEDYTDACKVYLETYPESKVYAFKDYVQALEFMTDQAHEL